MFVYVCMCVCVCLVTKSLIIICCLQSKAKERSFSWYYLWLNVGSLASEGGMPVLRQSVGFVITMIISAGEDGSLLRCGRGGAEE